MQLSVAEREGVAVVQLPGENLDASNAEALKEAAAPLLAAHSRLIFDMSQLQFVDSSGLGVLLSCLRRQNDAGHSLKLCALNKPVRALFELVRMHRVFDIYNTPEEAICAFAQETEDAAVGG